MSTKVQFAPSTNAAFTFRPVIAGVQYTAIITWNAFGQRYYLNLFDTSGALVLTTAVVSSGPHVSATMSWEDTGIGGLATATTAVPHNVPVGRLADIHVSQTGTVYDSNWQALSTGPDTLTFALPSPDESQPLAAQLSFNVNLVMPLGAGWLIYRYDVQSFVFE